jgi:hypothetical protein
MQLVVMTREFGFKNSKRVRVLAFLGSRKIKYQNIDIPTLLTAHGQSRPNTRFGFGLS